MLTLRISVSNDPTDVSNWEVVLEDSFENDGRPDLIHFPRTSPVREQRYVKFQVISYGKNQGCIQFFEVVRMPKMENSGK